MTIQELRHRLIQLHSAATLLRYEAEWLIRHGTLEAVGIKATQLLELDDETMRIRHKLEDAQRESEWKRADEVLERLVSERLKNIHMELQDRCMERAGR